MVYVFFICRYHRKFSALFPPGLLIHLCQDLKFIPQLWLQGTLFTPQPSDSTPSQGLRLIRCIILFRDTSSLSCLPPESPQVYEIKLFGSMSIRTLVFTFWKDLLQNPSFISCAKRYVWVSHKTESSSIGRSVFEKVESIQDSSK